MLRILEQKNLNAYQQEIQNLNIPAGLQVHLTEALNDDNQVKGYILYAYQPEAVIIYLLDDGQDWNYCDGLVRSVLFKGQLRGLEKAVFEITDSALKERLVKLGFVKHDGKILENISEIMESCKKCKESSSNT